MSYAKLFSSITESSLWSEPKEVRLLFVSMLAKADATGFVEASMPGLARLANLSLGEVEAGIIALESPDHHSKNPADEGRRILKVPGGWMFLNYEEYRNRRGDDERREYMRSYMKDYRARKQSVNSCKQSLTAVNHGKPPLAQAEAEAEAVTAQLPNQRLPTLEQVKAKCQLSGWPEAEGERFWHHFESSGWIDKNGHPIVKWESKLATWIADARAKPAEKAHHGNGGQAKSGISPSVQAMLDSKELERITDKMKTIKATYGDHQSWTDSDLEEFQTLKKRKLELKKSLGVTV